jgi:hypothetical protein
VVVAASPGEKLPEVYHQLAADGSIDTLIPMETKGRSVGEIDPHGIIAAIEAVETEYVLLIKLDTLPFRRGFENWLAEDLALIERHGLFGATGGFLIPDLTRLNATHSLAPKYSNNFSLFRKDDWLSVIRRWLSDGSAGAFNQDPRYQGDNVRYGLEVAIESYLSEAGKHMLIRHESSNWSVFHVNVWGERLRAVREQYLTRKGIGPFLNTGRPVTRPLAHPWQVYYLHPRPSRLRLLRIWLGEQRRKMFS